MLYKCAAVWSASSDPSAPDYWFCSLFVKKREFRLGSGFLSHGDMT